MNTKNWILFWIAGIAIIITCLSWIVADNNRIDREFCEEIENKETFTQEDIERLYHWRHNLDEGCCSERFKKLYDEKIKPL